MSKYLVTANIEGVSDFVINEKFTYRFMALKAARIALKKNLIVRICKIS